MPLIQTDSQHYSDIADAIRDMSGNEETFYPSEMAAGVRSIPQTIAIQPIIYSLEEREVGVWTDGKPLYQKTVHIDSLPNNAYTSGYYAHGISNLDKIHNVFGTVTFSSGNVSHLPRLGMFNNSATDVFSSSITITSITLTEIEIITGTDRSNCSADITLLYTKTTDTPGSGTWTPSGVPAHHYSTDEQVIGTWVDGSTLYEKTYIFDTVISLSSNTWINTSYNGNFIKGIIDCKGYAENMIPNAGLLASKSSNNLIQILNLRTSAINCRGFTLQYTKTTD